MFTTQDLLNVALAIGFIAIAGFASYAFYNLALTLKEIKELIVSIKLMREGINVGILSFVKRILEGRR